MQNTPYPNTSASLDKAASTLDPVLHAAGRAAADTLDGMSRDARNMALDGAHALQEGARHARDSTTRYIQERPLPAVLIAAGTGMLLVVLGGLLVRALGRSH